ncbi:SRPBCC family protein [Streptacidiphilus albus]|uniref:SRPBCC family protein n=1 Tax=Streptacidiphilus albus TaxID=105425 RepID=UPI00054B8A80|nr:SRPBCC family protein [Streptacidiphilus albus]
MRGRLLYRGPRLDELHQQYAKRGRIDRDAQVQAFHSLRIEAPPDQVWALLSDVPRWPAWAATVRDVRVPEGLAVDLPFSWRIQGSKIVSRIAVLTPEREMTWTGVCSGGMAKAVHRHRLRAEGDGTVVSAEESIAGLLLPLFYSSEKLQQSMEDWLAGLRAAAE